MFAARVVWVLWLTTFYDLDWACTGKAPGHPAFGITRSGARAVVGVTVACDPALLGRRVLIEGIGVRVCQDTGGMVHAGHVDVLVRDHATALRLGRQARRVRVLAK